MVPRTPYLFPGESADLQSYDMSLLSNLPGSQPVSSGYEFNQQPSSSSNSLLTFDDTQVELVDQRKERRMISNRESARRSRVRKRMQHDALMSQLMQVQSENQDLVYKLKRVSDCHDLVLEENTKLQEQVMDIRKFISAVQVERPHPFFEDITQDC